MRWDQVASFIDERLFIKELSAQKKESVLQELLKPLTDHSLLQSADLIFETLKQRELLGSTGIGKGIAIPHCRSTVVSELLLVIGRSEQGILFDSVDKKPVHLFFLIIAPPIDESNQYLPLLGKLVESVRDSKRRKELLKAEHFDQFKQIFLKG
jgi:fructose-specific phosphotransferase system IIA component